MNTLVRALWVMMSIELAASGCGSRSTPIDDAGADADDDVGGDADREIATDADGDRGPDSEVRSDAEVPVEHWSWSSIELPNQLDGDYVSTAIWAVEDDDVVLCTCDPIDERGGMGRFDGDAVTAEETGVCCQIVFGIDAARVWAVTSSLSGGPVTVSRRTGTSWNEETVDTMEGCSFEAFFAYEEQAMATIRCGSGDRWPLTHIGDRWSMSAMWVPPMSQMSFIGGAFNAGSSYVFFGQTASSEETNALVTLGSDTDLGYSPDIARWAGGASLSDIAALEGNELHVLSGSTWSSIACPEDIPDSEWITCWHTGARSASGDVFLGGGNGSSGDSGSDDLRLHWWDGETLRQILEPCGGSLPACGVEDLAVTDDRLYVLVRREWRTSLLWADLPR